jgi:hypothetical protein
LDASRWFSLTAFRHLDDALLSIKGSNSKTKQNKTKAKHNNKKTFPVFSICFFSNSFLN